MSGKFLPCFETAIMDGNKKDDGMKVAHSFDYRYCRIFDTLTGFPPIREFRENFEDFFQSGKSGKKRGFSAKIREKIFKSGNFFSKPFLNLLNL